MDKIIADTFEKLSSTNDKVRFDALQNILSMTEDKVDWAYEVWDDLLGKLDDQNSYQRSIAIMVLCNLAKSDGENRLQPILGKLLAHTRDEKFITSRQCIQNIWKVAAVNQAAREAILAHLEQQFEGCEGEKHYNLIRQDIIQALGCLYESVKDNRVLGSAQELLDKEKDAKYRKKYQAILGAR